MPNRRASRTFIHMATNCESLLAEGFQRHGLAMKRSTIGVTLGYEVDYSIVRKEFKRDGL